MNPRRRPTVWLFAAACWTLLGVFFATQTFVSYGYSRRTVTWSRALELALAEYYLWGLASILVLWLARRFPFERGRIGRALAIHLPAGIAVPVLHLGAYSLVAAWVSSTPQRKVDAADLYRAFFGQKIHPGVLIYWVIVGVAHGLSYYRRFRDRELRDQATRAAKSCFLCLCEGLPNEGAAMRHKYFVESRNSLAETVGALDLAAVIGVVRREDADTIQHLACRLRRMLTALLR